MHFKTEEVYILVWMQAGGSSPHKKKIYD